MTAMNVFCVPRIFKCLQWSMKYFLLVLHSVSSNNPDDAPFIVPQYVYKFCVSTIDGSIQYNINANLNAVLDCGSVFLVLYAFIVALQFMLDIKVLKLKVGYVEYHL